jgi:type I restriction enzyme S subunit
MTVRELAYVPLRHLADVRSSNVDKKTDPQDIPVRLVNYTDVYYQSEITPKLGLMQATATAEQLERFRVLPGDSIITKDSETPGDIAVPAYVSAADAEMVCGYHLAILRPGPGVDPKFFYWTLNSDFVGEQFSAKANGMTRFGLGIDSIRSTCIPVPPIEEQRRIADFLDDQVGRIDQAIELRTGQVAGFRSRLDSESLRLLTQGITPTEKRKTASQSWFHEIPQTWQDPQLARLACFRAGNFINAEEITELGDFPVFGANGLRGYGGHFTHEGSTVLVGRQGALCGNVILVSGKFWASEHALVAYPNVNFSLDWFAHALRAMNLGQYSVSAAQPGISVERINSLRVPLPPLEEQVAIARSLDQLAMSTDRVERLIRNSLEQIQERKRSLITAAVTGQLDVTVARPLTGPWVSSGMGVSVESPAQAAGVAL